MADRYWVGGTANWDATAGTKWATTSGGAGGASVPGSSDVVYFDANSGAVTVTVSALVACSNLIFTGFTGTFAGSSTIYVYGNTTSNIVLSPSMSWTHSGSILLYTSNVTYLFTSNGKSITSSINLSSPNVTLSLQDAFVTSGDLTVTSGIFTTNNFNVTAASLSSSNSNTRTINLGSSTVTLSGASGAVNFATQTGLTFNAGTSTISMSSGGATFVVGTGVTFYDVSWTSTAISNIAIQGANTFNNLTVAGRASAGIAALRIDADQTINGTLTLSAGTNATMRTFVRSDTLETTRTLTCAAVASLTDIDFRDITIAGAAAPVSGTRLGDCKGNSGITFDAAKTVYWNLAGNNSWSATAWATTGGGTPSINNFPLAQDTAVFQSTSPATGAATTVNAAYNIGTIDMSARTSNTMTLATGSATPTIYGNWINGTGTTLTGTTVLTFSGRGSQTITSAGKAFTQQITFATPAGSVGLTDAITSSSVLRLVNGTFNTNNYATTTTSFLPGSLSGTRALLLGSATLTLTLSGTVWNYTGTNLTVTGTGTISLTSASAKTFSGGGIQTYPTINQGGTGTLTITGSNKFANITDTAIGRVQFTGGTTNEFTAFNLGGVAGNLLQLGSTNTTQVTLKAPSWKVGANSTDAGNNTGLSFTAGTIDYLSISYVNGIETGPTPTSSIYYGSGNVTSIYYGSTPVSAIYYGSAKVF